nr:hypothetical protein Iba_scaffold825CG0050 [Ipomoea batatas]
MKPVTLVREVAMAAPESESSPRWPTIIIPIVVTSCWEIVTTTMGSAMQLTFFSSSQNASHLDHIPLFLPGPASTSRSNGASSIVFSLFLSPVPCVSNTIVARGLPWDLSYWIGWVKELIALMS